MKITFSEALQSPSFTMTSGQGGTAPEVQKVNLHVKAEVDAVNLVHCQQCRPVGVEVSVHVHLVHRKHNQVKSELFGLD